MNNPGPIPQEMTKAGKEALANLVPAAAVIRGGQTLFGFTGLKGRVGGRICRG